MFIKMLLLIFRENKSRRELTDPSLLNSTNPLDDSLTSIGKPTPLTNRFSFMNENEALIIKDANRLMWMVVRGQRSFLFQNKIQPNGSTFKIVYHISGMS